jgi:hypothetical protein
VAGAGRSRRVQAGVTVDIQLTSKDGVKLEIASDQAMDATWIAVEK